MKRKIFDIHQIRDAIMRMEGFKAGSLQLSVTGVQGKHEHSSP